MRYSCCDERRAEIVASTGIGNGIDFIEVVDGEGVAPADQQRLLEVHFINKPQELQTIEPEDIHIEGGTRITGITVVPPLVWNGNVLTLRVSTPGDYSIYTLRIDDTDVEQSARLDPLLNAVDFTFKVACETSFDCNDVAECPAEPFDDPEIDYLARDYASFRQVMLDRLAVTAPEWKERNPADIGVVLVEVLAYAADHLSYQLDATAMESSLATARRRASVKQHARLVDYRLHDGSNARVWVHVAVSQMVDLDVGTQLLTTVPDLGKVLTKGSSDFALAMQSNPLVFETMESRTLHPALNNLKFYTWGDRECCLPVGATQATLAGALGDLEVGQVLIFEELLDPVSGSRNDANPAHRHAVRLTERPEIVVDPLGQEITGENQPVQVTRITWGAEDALPNALWLSAEVPGPAGHIDYVNDVSMAHGNIVLADHGMTITELDWEPVPAADDRLAYPAGGTHCSPVEKMQRPARYAPALKTLGLTRTGTIGRALKENTPRRWDAFNPRDSAASAFQWQARHVMPDITLLEEETLLEWTPRADLLGSSAFSREFVATTEIDGQTTLRFGDGEYGMRPRPGTRLIPTYRIGNGPVGNIGVDSIGHIVSELGGIELVRNPIAARGGTSPEPLARARQDAPVAYRVPERAVTPADYARMAERHPQVQRAIGTERWTGSWYTMFLTIDRRDGLPVDRGFELDMRNHLERYRMAGHDLEIDGPRFVALEIELGICAMPDYYRSDVEEGIRRVLGRGRSIDGQLMYFHPDKFSFGDPVYLSGVLAAVQAVEGVRWVEPIMFRRLGESRIKVEADGVLRFGALEIGRLDNDPNFRDRGVLRLNMEGGR